MMIGLNCRVPIIVTGFTSSLWYCHNINFGPILHNWQNWSCFDTKLKFMLFQTLRNPCTVLLRLIHLPNKFVTCIPKRLSHSLLSTALSPVGYWHFDLKPQMVLWIFCRPRNRVENRSLVFHLSQLYIHGGRHICLTRQSTLGLKMHNQSCATLHNPLEIAPWVAVEKSVYLTLASLLILCDVPLVNLLNPMWWAILRTNLFQRLAQKWNSSNDEMTVVVLLLTAWIPPTWENKNRPTLAISTTQRHWVSTCFKESHVWYTCTHHLHKMWLCCVFAKLSSVWPVVSLQVQFINVAANLNKQKRGMLFSVVKETTGQCFIVNATVMTCRQR